MQNLSRKTRKFIVVIFAIILFPLSGACEPISFLPMEDSMSAARTATEFSNDNIKPYRQSFNLGMQESDTELLDFSTIDICAFILLAGIYVMLTKRSSASRNASF